jgi:hypothetical protein
MKTGVNDRHPAPRPLNQIRHALEGITDRFGHGNMTQRQLEVHIRAGFECVLEMSARIEETYETRDSATIDRQASIITPETQGKRIEPRHSPAGKSQLIIAPGTRDKAG